MQGACQDMEDASFMTNMLTKHGDNFEEAFKKFQKERMPRTAFVHMMGRNHS